MPTKRKPVKSREKRRESNEEFLAAELIPKLPLAPWTCPDCGHSWWNHGPAAKFESIGCVLCECGGSRPPEPDFAAIEHALLGRSEVWREPVERMSFAEMYGGAAPFDARAEVHRRFPSYRCAAGQQREHMPACEDETAYLQKIFDMGRAAGPRKDR